LKSLECAPSIFDPSEAFLSSGDWQSGIGSNEDLTLSRINKIRTNDVETWIPKILHGSFYDYNEGHYLFSDDYIVQQFYTNQTVSGLQYVDLTHRLKPGIPIQVRRYYFN
jgi:hypothetical protein